MMLYLLNLADLATTLIALALGCVEMNPIVACLIDIHPALYAVVKLIPALPLCLWLGRNARTGWGAMVRYIILCCVFGAVVGSNIVNIAVMTAA